MKDTADLIKGILTSNSWSTSNIKKVYGIDLVNYSWVDSYLRDKEFRSKIISLEKEIPNIESLPIHRDELKVNFMEALKQINGMMLNQIKGHLSNVQQRKTGLMGSESIQSLCIVHPLNLNEKEIDRLFSELPEGIKKNEIVKRVKTTTSEIDRLSEIIKNELSPKERWIHYENGNPQPYPEGCLWTRFVNDWKMVVSRFNGNVNINGCALESEAEATAFFALKMDKVYKREPLLKVLIKPRTKTTAESYNESVTINYPS